MSKTLQHILLTLLAITAILNYTGCSDDKKDCREKGVAFEISLGLSYCISGDATAKILSIEDNYCPCNANCVWEGEATVSAAISSSNDTKVDTIQLHELREIGNVYNLYIHEVITTEACDPDVASISLILR